jgi:hypothetical protein
MDSRRDELINQLFEKSICSICQESVSYTVEIWSCNICYQFFHLKCINQWALQKISKEVTWNCPWCQSFSVDVPNEYRVCLDILCFLNFISVFL